MSDRPQRAGLFVRVVVTLVVVGLVFGGGVLIGWGTREKRAPAMETRAAEVSDADVKKELAACLRGLKARSKKARVTRPERVVPAPGEASDAGLEEAAKVEAVQKDVEECKVRETLANAHVCGTIEQQINLLSVFLNGSGCTDTGGVDDYLSSSIDRCAEFEEFPTHLDEDTLGKAEQLEVIAAQNNRRRFGKETLLGWKEGIARRCRERREKGSE